VQELKATTLVKTLKALDVHRRPERFKDYVLVCTADARGRLGFEDRDYPQADYIREAADVFCGVDTAAIASATTDKSYIADAITQAQVSSIKKWIRAV